MVGSTSFVSYRLITNLCKEGGNCLVSILSAAPTCREKPRDQGSQVFTGPLCRASSPDSLWLCDKPKPEKSLGTEYISEEMSARPRPSLRDGHIAKAFLCHAPTAMAAEVLPDGESLPTVSTGKRRQGFFIILALDVAAKQCRLVIMARHVLSQTLFLLCDSFLHMTV